MNSQVVFFLSELSLSILNLFSLRSDSLNKPHYIWISITLSSIHIVRSAFDQWNPVLGVKLMFYCDVINVSLLGYFLYFHCLEKEYSELGWKHVNLLKQKNDSTELLSKSPLFYTVNHLRTHALMSVAATMIGLLLFSNI